MLIRLVSPLLRRLIFLCRGSSVRDDYWDGGGAVIVAEASSARFRLTRFDDGRVVIYNDRRRQCVLRRTTIPTAQISSSTFRQNEKTLIASTTLFPRSGPSRAEGAL